MKVDAVRAKALVSQLQEVQHRIANVAKGRNVSFMCDACSTPTTLHCNIKPSGSRLTLVAHGAVAAAPELLRCRKGRTGRWTRCGGWQRTEKKHGKSSQNAHDTETDAPSQVRLVAVSKLKPANDILALHREPASQLHFGENYAQELGQKAELLPRSIRWHFIGGLQSTHCKTLAKIPNLFAVSSVDSAKKAQLLNKARGDLIASSSSPDSVPRLNVHVQVNTSGEESKSGVAPGADVVALSRLVLAECPHLNLLGFMTIGAIARSVATTPENENEDFVRLREQRDLVASELADLLAARGDGGDQPLELSMGMSEDFEGAIALGSGEVRVGSTIFGTRGPKSEAKIVV